MVVDTFSMDEMNDVDEQIYESLYCPSSIRLQWKILLILVCALTWGFHVMTTFKAKTKGVCKGREWLQARVKEDLFWETFLKNTSQTGPNCNFYINTITL